MFNIYVTHYCRVGTSWGKLESLRDFEISLYEMILVFVFVCTIFSDKPVEKYFRYTVNSFQRVIADMTWKFSVDTKFGVKQNVGLFYTLSQVNCLKFVHSFSSFWKLYLNWKTWIALSASKNIFPTFWTEWIWFQPI